MRAFVERELRPRAPEWEAARCFPDTVFGRLAERGWLGLKYGEDADWVADAVLSEEIARCGSGGLAAGVGAHIGIATPPLASFGTEAQRERWLAPAVRGEKTRRSRSRSPTPAPTSPPSARAPSASTAAGSSTAPRPSSPTACERTST